jgi:hypothetical protein
MRRGSWVLMIAALVAAGACATSSPRAARPPPPSPEARATKPIDWSTREASHKPWRAPGKRLQLVVTGGQAKGEHYAWLVANGTVVLSIYRCAEGEVQQVIDAFLGDMTLATVATPSDSASWGILGAAIKPDPPPPPPEPGGFPLKYIGEVMTTAWRMDRQVQGLSGAVIAD